MRGAQFHADRHDHDCNNLQQHRPDRGYPYSYRVAPRMRRRTWAPTQHLPLPPLPQGGTPVTPAFKQTNNAVPQTPVSTVNVTFTAAQSAGD